MKFVRFLETQKKTTESQRICILCVYVLVRFARAALELRFPLIRSVSFMLSIRAQPRRKVKFSGGCSIIHTDVCGLNNTF